MKAVMYTNVEGGKWIPWGNEEEPIKSDFGAILFEDGTIFDRVALVNQLEADREMHRRHTFFIDSMSPEEVKQCLDNWDLDKAYDGIFSILLEKKV